MFTPGSLEERGGGRELVREMEKKKKTSLC